MSCTLWGRIEHSEQFNLLFHTIVSSDCCYCFLSLYVARTTSNEYIEQFFLSLWTKLNWKMTFTHDCIHFDWFVVFLLITKCVLMLNSASHPNIYTEKFILKSFIIINWSWFGSSPYCMDSQNQTKEFAKPHSIGLSKDAFFLPFSNSSYKSLHNLL